MDFLRTAYKTKFKPWRDDPTEIEVRWFRCPDNVVSVPMPTVYSSGLWDDPKDIRVDVGDVYPQQRTWQAGENLAGYLGVAPCGPRQAFNTGGEHGRDPAIVTDASGVAACCKTIRLLPLGGFGLGGAAIFNQEVLVSGGKGVGGHFRSAHGPAYIFAGGKGVGGHFRSAHGPAYIFAGGKGVGGHFPEVINVGYEWHGGKGLGGHFRSAAGPAYIFHGGKGLGGHFVSVTGIGYRFKGGKGIGGTFKAGKPFAGGKGLGGHFRSAHGPAYVFAGGKGLGGHFRSAAGPAYVFAGGKGLGGHFRSAGGPFYFFAGGKGLGGSFRATPGPAYIFAGGKGLGGAFASAPGPAYIFAGGKGLGGAFASAPGPAYGWTGGSGAGGFFLTANGPGYIFAGGKGVGGSMTSSDSGDMGVQTLLGNEALVTSGGAMTFFADSAEWLGGYWGHNPANNGDTREWTFLLPAGTWNLNLLYPQFSNLGQVDVIIDGSPVLIALDAYNSSLVRNFITTQSFTLSTGGQHTLKMQVVGRNASSSGYYFLVTQIWFTT